MKKTLKLYLCFLLLLSHTLLLAHHSLLKQEKPNKHAVGIAAGFTTGYGLSYRYQPYKLGVQVTFAPYVDKQTDRYSAGLTFLYTLIPGEVTSLFLYQGNHYFYNSETVYYTNDKPPTADPILDKRRAKEDYFNNGLGIGMEIVFASRIGFNLMMGYAAYNSFTQMNITGETALYFKF